MENPSVKPMGGTTMTRQELDESGRLQAAADAEVRNLRHMQSQGPRPAPMGDTGGNSASQGGL